MIEFNTNDDLHTIMQYTRSTNKAKGYIGVTCVDIEQLSATKEAVSKITADMILSKIITNK